MVGAGYGGHSMVAPLRRVVVKRPEEAFRGPGSIAGQWRDLGYGAPPDLESAAREHRELVRILREAGAEVLFLPEDRRTGLDSLYTHDPGMITDAGAIVFQTGKPQRRGEAQALADSLEAWGVPLLGVVDGRATVEGGDLVWLDPATLAVGRGYRTNAAGVAALQELLAPVGVRVLEFQLPHWRGPGEVLHLQSLVSFADVDLAVVHRPLMPVAFLQALDERDVRLIDVPEEEFPSQASNILALSPREVVMLAGNPRTRDALSSQGCRIQEIQGRDIAEKGLGGPTCLTRPLERS